MKNKKPSIDGFSDEQMKVIEDVIHRHQVELYELLRTLKKENHEKKKEKLQQSEKSERIHIQGQKPEKEKKP